MSPNKASNGANKNSKNSNNMPSRTIRDDKLISSVDPPARSDRDVVGAASATSEGKKTSATTTTNTAAQKKVIQQTAPPTIEETSASRGATKTEKREKNVGRTSSACNESKPASTKAAKKVVTRTKSMPPEEAPKTSQTTTVVKTKSNSPKAAATPKKTSSASVGAPRKTPAKQEQSPNGETVVRKVVVQKPASLKVGKRPSSAGDAATQKPASMSCLETKPTTSKRKSSSPKTATKAAPAPANKASVAKVSPKSDPTFAKLPPVSPRSDISKKLSEHEAKVLAGTGGGKRKSTTSSPPAPPQGPGAYKVQGRNVARAHSGVLSPQDRKAEEKKFENAPTIVSGSIPAPDLVVAAELSEDMEAQIEEEVRRRILSQSARAHVISVVHGQRLYDPEEETRRLADLREKHKPRGVKEKLFGDARNSDIDISSSPECIRKRNYLKWTVKRNPTTNMWVASCQTSQKATEANDIIEIERTTMSWSATTQQEAFETGLGNATPLMQPVEENPICYVCKAKFALFRRPQHCRNCGVCVCTSCSTTWPTKMLPETYIAKSSSLANVCMACDWLANSFRDALVEGNYKTAIFLYATGNVNVRTPFCLEKRAEEM
jgi:hypothetical protein